MHHFRKKWNISLSLVLCVLILSAMLVPAMAAGNSGSIQLVFDPQRFEQQNLEHAYFQLYRVGTVSSGGSIIPDGRFEGFQFDPNGDNWYELANSLDSAVNGMPCDYEGTVEGNRVFFASLPNGLYFLPSVAVNTGDSAYRFSPILVAVPGTAENGSVEADRVIQMNKFEETPKINLAVYKNWIYSGQHPAEITVRLLCNGEYYTGTDFPQSIVLNEANGWRDLTSWLGLPQGCWDENGKWVPYEWSVEEVPVPGYNTSITVSKNFVIDGVSYDLIKITNSPDNPKLPQTGLNWTPVAVLVLLGLACMMIGVICRRHGENE